MELNIHPISNHFMCEMVDHSENKTQALYDVIFVLDTSASMGQSVQFIINIIYPMLLNKLNINNKPINLITFDSITQYYGGTIEQIQNKNIQCKGRTFMHDVPKLITKVLHHKCTTHNILLLTLSDGELFDAKETINEMEKFKLEHGHKYNFVSRTIRLQTDSTNRGDTKALATFLQLDTTTDIHIADVNYLAEPETIIKQFSKCIENICFFKTYNLQTDSPCIKDEPWSAPKTTHVVSNTNNNVFWLESIPEKFIVNDVLIKPNILPEITSYNNLLETKTKHYMNQIKILKVLGKQNNCTEITKIIDYFSKLEHIFDSKRVSFDELKQDKGLQSRGIYYKELVRKNKSKVSFLMSQLANDNKINKLNSCQQAQYLRTLDINSSGAKNLARRANQSGLDFDTTIIKEVKTMKTHIDELKDVDDSNHYVSFYSQETTLSGIKELCNLVDNENTIDEMTALDIIKMLNLVGVPCDAPIGDYTDPMCYRINKLYLGSCVSLSDVLVVQDMGHDLETPHGNYKIINVVPFFDDTRIQNFLQKYAPTLLECYTSVGMRRMLVNINTTYIYTIMPALWCIICELNTHKTEANIDIFKKLCKTFKNGIGNMFSNVVPFITKDQTPTLSYCIKNNGITNMLSPLMTVIQTQKVPYMNRILSALYSFESYQYTRKLFKGSDHKKQKVEFLQKLLGVDFDKYGQKVSPLFEDEPQNIKFYDQYHFDETECNSMLSHIKYVDYTTLIEPFLTEVLHGGNIIKNMEPIDDNFIKTSLHLNYDLRTFKIFCLIQSILYDEKSSRIDETTGNMKFCDCLNYNAANKMVRDFVKKQYYDKYQADLCEKGKTEHKKLSEMYINMLVETTSMEEFKTLLKEGLTINKTTEIISDTYKLGYTELKNKLFSLQENVQNRRHKLYIFILGIDKSGNIIWNNGNNLPFSMVEILQMLHSIGMDDLWNEIKDLFAQKLLHIYRLHGPNRHSHCNEKPSYWAKGFKTLEEFICNSSENEWEEYRKIHIDCCGVPRWRETFNKNN